MTFLKFVYSFSLYFGSRIKFTKCTKIQYKSFCSFHKHRPVYLTYCVIEHNVAIKENNSAGLMLWKNNPLCKGCVEGVMDPPAALQRFSL